MQTQQRLEFETRDRKELYEYIERNGTVTREELTEEFSMGNERLNEELVALEADGYLEERDEGLGIGVDIGTGAEFEADGITYTSVRRNRTTSLVSWPPCGRSPRNRTTSSPKPRLIWWTTSR